jgi:hypothetical protein
MNYIQIKIINNSSPFVSTFASKGVITLDSNNLDAGELRIVRYQAVGLNSGNSPIFISFTSGALNTSPVITGSNVDNFYRGSSTEFMLPTIYDPSSNGNSSWEFNTPLVIMSGDNLMNGSRQIQYQVLDLNGNYYNLGSLVITMEYIPVSRYNPRPGDRQITQKEKSELVSRNQFFRSTTNFDPNVNYSGYSNM